MGLTAVTPHTYRPLGPREKLGLTGEILATYVRIWRRVRREQITDLVESLRAPSAVEPVGSFDAVRLANLGHRLGWAVTRTLKLLPTDSRCLMQSLVLTEVLARRGIPATLVIGVNPGPKFGAHAWVEHEGYPLLPPGDADQHRLIEL